MFFSHGTKEDALVVEVKAYPCGIYDMGAWEQKQGMEWRDGEKGGGSSRSCKRQCLRRDASRVNPASLLTTTEGLSLFTMPYIHKYASVQNAQVC